MPWGDLDVTQIDSFYIDGHSGDKYITPFVMKHMINGKLPQASVNILAGTIKQIYKPTWERLWEIYIAEYNPLENYNMHEVTTAKESGKEIMDRTHAGSNVSVSEADDSENTTQNSVYAFNSAASVPSAESKQNSKVTTTTTPGASDKEQKSFDQRQTETTVDRSGNIGVTSAMDMLSQGLELWKSFGFWEVVFSDLDNVLVLDVY